MTENNKNANDYGVVQCNKDIFIITSAGVAKAVAALLWVADTRVWRQVLIELDVASAPPHPPAPRCLVTPAAAPMSGTAAG